MSIKSGVIGVLLGQVSEPVRIGSIDGRGFLPSREGQLLTPRRNTGRRR